jgi:hypothetical protein
MDVHPEKRLRLIFWCNLFTRGCRVSTGEQIVELQAEVSVRTLVKQPTKN